MQFCILLSLLLAVFSFHWPAGLVEPIWAPGYQITHALRRQLNGTKRKLDGHSGEYSPLLQPDRPLARWTRPAAAARVNDFQVMTAPSLQSSGRATCHLIALVRLSPEVGHWAREWPCEIHTGFLRNRPSLGCKMATRARPPIEAAGGGGGAPDARNRRQLTSRSQAQLLIVGGRLLSARGPG